MNHHLSNPITFLSQDFYGLHSIIQLPGQWVGHSIQKFPEFEGLYLKHEIKRLEEKQNSSEFALMTKIWGIKSRLSFLSYLYLLPRGKNGWAKTNSRWYQRLLEGRITETIVFLDNKSPSGLWVAGFLATNSILAIGSLPLISNQTKYPCEVVESCSGRTWQEWSGMSQWDL